MAKELIDTNPFEKESECAEPAQSACAENARLKKNH